MPGSLRHPRAESGRLRSPVGGGSPGPLHCSQAPGFAPSRPAPPVCSGSPFASKSGRRLPTQPGPPPPLSRLEPASPRRLPHGPPAARLGSPPPRLASPPLSPSPPLSSRPSSAPRPSAGCRLPPPLSAAQPGAGSLRPGRADPPSPLHPGLRQCAGRAGSGGGRCSSGRNRDGEAAAGEQSASLLSLSVPLVVGTKGIEGLGGLAGLWGI